MKLFCACVRLTRQSLSTAAQAEQTRLMAKESINHPSVVIIVFRNFRFEPMAD